MAVKCASYDDVYKVYAWRDNRRKLVVTQGEGLSSNSTDANTYIKTAKFQLCDERGVIELPNSTTAISLALKKNNGAEVLVSAFYDYTDDSTVKSEDKENGIVYFAITQSMTDIAGEVTGEIRLTTSTGVIKFYGINFYVFDGVSSNAAIQSNDFDHLVNALNKVEAVTGDGTIVTMDSVIEHGGLHPVSSGVIYDFVDGNYIRYKSISGAEADTANDARAIYTHHVNGGFRGLVFFVGYNNYNGSTTVRQFRLCKNGKFEYRDGTVITPAVTPNTYTWDKTYDEDWKPIGSTQNIQDLAVTTAKLANQAVTSAKIGNGEVKTSNINDNAITTGKIADNNVTPIKLDRKYTEFLEISSSNIDSATSNGIIYKVSLDGRTNYLFCVNSGTNLLTQYRFDTLGYAKYRTKSSTDNTWSDWKPIGSTQNIQDSSITTSKIGNGQVTPEKLSKSYVEKSAIIAGIDLQDDITSEELAKALAGYSLYWHEDEYNPSVISDEVPFPCLWHNTTNDTYFIVYNGEYSSDGWAYTSYQIPKTRVGAGSVSSSGVIGETYINMSKDSVSICFGDTKWLEIPLCDGTFEFARSFLHIDEITGEGIIPTTTSIGQLFDEWWTLDENDRYVCYKLIEIDTSSDSPIYNWQKQVSPQLTIGGIDLQNDITAAELAAALAESLVRDNNIIDYVPEILIGTTDKPATEDGTSIKQYIKTDRYINKYNGKIWVCTNAVQVSEILPNNVPRIYWQYTWSAKGNIYNYPKQISCTLRQADWSNNQIVLSGQLWAMADGRKRVDVDIDQSTYLQLCADGCGGLFVITDDSGSTPIFTMNAIGNVPTTDITVQLTLWHVVD